MAKNVVIDWAKAEAVFGILLRQLKNEQYPYDFAKPPQRPEAMPNGLVWGSVEHACFLWCCCYYMRGGIKSDTAIQSLGKMYLEAPELFQPAHFLPNSSWDAQKQDSMDKGMRSRIRRLLRKYGLGFNSKTQVPRDWVYNFRKISQFWKGDPAEIFRNVKDYDDLCRIIMHKGSKSPEKPTGFFGFREKMVSMITYFLLDAGIIQHMMFPVPVDFHVLRIMLAHEILTVEGLEPADNHYLPEVQAAARQVSTSYCEKHGVNPLRLGDALWLFSGAMCAMYPGNKSTISKARRGRKTPIRRHFLQWDRTQLNLFNKSCGRCQIAGTCMHRIQQSNYYVAGRLRKMGPRVEPPALFRLSLAEEAPTSFTA